MSRKPASSSGSSRASSNSSSRSSSRSRSRTPSKLTSPAGAIGKKSSSPHMKPSPAKSPRPSRSRGSSAGGRSRHPLTTSQTAPGMPSSDLLSKPTPPRMPPTRMQMQGAGSEGGVHSASSSDSGGTPTHGGHDGPPARTAHEDFGLYTLFSCVSTVSFILCACSRRVAPRPVVTNHAAAVCCSSERSSRADRADTGARWL